MRLAQVGVGLSLVALATSATPSRPIPFPIVVAGVTIGKDTLHTVQARLGRRRLRDLDADRAIGICYDVSRPGRPLILLLGSAIEMGGPEQTITSARLVAGHVARDRKSDCGATPALKEVPRLPADLDIDMSLEDFQAIAVPESTPDSDGRIEAASCESIPLPKDDPSFAYWDQHRDGCFEGKEPYFWRCTVLRARFVRAKAVEVAIQQVEGAC